MFLFIVTFFLLVTFIFKYKGVYDHKMFLGEDVVLPLAFSFFFDFHLKTQPAFLAFGKIS